MWVSGRKSSRLLSFATSAEKHWAQALAEWAIPQEILARTADSPWEFPPGVFERRADRAASNKTPSTVRALEALPAGGSVLDVGCGAGAASLALASKAGEIIGVDTSARFLEEFQKRGRAGGLATATIQGRWPEIAGKTPVADVAVCHHVVYNVPDLSAFATALTEHARSRVVVEMTLNHPRSHLNELWLHFHHQARPKGPTADDAVAVLREIGLDVQIEVWTPSKPSTWFESLDEAIAWNRRQLCLIPSEDAELAKLLRPRLAEIDGMLAQPPSPRATVWWPGSAH